MRLSYVGIFYRKWSKKMKYMEESLEEIIRNKKVLFVTTKNIDYIRNVQEINILKMYSKELNAIFSVRKGYVGRILEVWIKLFMYNMKDIDVVFVGFAPQLIIPFVGRLLKEKTIIMDFFISVYDTLICDRKKFKDGSLIANICHQLDEKTLKKANHVITDTKAHAEYFISEFSVREDICETIYLKADTTIYYPRPQNKPEELKNKFVVLYFGSILPLQGVNVVLDAIRELRDRGDIFFDIIGPIPEKYNKPIQNNVRYINWLSQIDLAEHIANADLCLAGHFNQAIEKARRTIPGKAYIYQSMKKPMVCGDNKANRELFVESEMIHFVPMGSAEKLRNIIDSISKQYASKL